MLPLQPLIPNEVLPLKFSLSATAIMHPLELLPVNKSVSVLKYIAPLNTVEELPLI